MVAKAWLAQDDVRQGFLNEGRGPWTTVFLSRRDSQRESMGIYCAFAPTAYRPQAVQGAGWDLRPTDGRPGFSQGWDADGTKQTTYHRRGGSDTLEPLILRREFYGSRPGDLEVAEEFRLYHNLWWDEPNRRFIKPSEDGSEQVAVEIGDHEVRVRTLLLRQFQAAKQVDLLLFIDSVHFAASADEQAPPTRQWRDDHLCAGRYAGDGAAGMLPFTRFLATRALPPPPIERAGIWPFEAEEYFPDFVIDVDEDGVEVRHTCNPDALANYFGVNPEAPHYLTPVHFQREVLQKYYNRPELFTVEDGLLRCAGLWGLRMDNDHPEHVVVFLGDLGRDLPQGERDYWRSFNVAPDAGLSETGFRRAFLGQFADPQAPDLQLRRAYEKLMRDWPASEGWALFRELQGPDRHLVQQLRVPLNDSQAEFEECIKVLAKLLTDGLDDKGIQSQLAERVPNEKSIAKLERWLRSQDYPWVERDVKLLRDLQELRSKVSAHRKGSDYEKTLDKLLGSERGQRAAVGLVSRSLATLEALNGWREQRALGTGTTKQ